MSKKITLENVDSSELPEIPVIGEVKQIRFTQDMELVSTLADSDLFMVQVGADLEARPNTITFDLIIKNLSGPIEEGSKKFVTGDEMFKVIGDITLLDTWDNTNIVSSLNATYVNVRRIEEELRREINRSTGKDEQHDEQIANLRQDLTATNEMLNQEINRSVAKDREHDELLAGLRDDVDSTSDKLDAEIDRSTAKDAEHDTLLKGLRVDVNANKSAIDSEVARSTARDEAHDTAIANNASDITTEVNRAKAEEAKIRQEMKTADTNLQNAITAETERATGVEEDLQRQITDLSGSTDDRLEALEALSHEQNTDTGTTSKTFVIDSGNTGAMLKAEGGGLSTRTKGDAGYANFTVQNLVIKGDVTQEGDTFITQAERVEVRDNMILINEGETGAGVTAGFAGIEVDRGTEQNFMFGFNESDGMFKIGKEGNMFDVALRQPVGDMIDGMFASWDAATKTFKTTNVIPYNKSLDFKFDPEIVDATLKMKFMEAGLGLSMSGDDSILALLPGMPQDEVKYSLISTNTNGIILGYSSGSNDKFILDIKKPSFISPVLDKNVIIGGKNAYFSYYSHSVGSPNTIIASCGVKAPSFYRASDNAEVLYSLDQARLTDGMFLSWDATNKMLVANNLVPEGIKLYFGTSSNYIDYHNEGNGYIRFITNTGVLRFSTNNNFTTFRSSSNNGFQFIGKIETSDGVLNSLSDNLTIGTKQGMGSIKLYIGESSYITTPFSAVTFKRSSDDSEVLYQADLKSVLTGKETNYAPTVKAVSDAIDAVNTGTTESLKGYLKLSGGNMTGHITMNNGIGIRSLDTNGNSKRVIAKVNTNSVYIGDEDGGCVIYTNDTNVGHYVNGATYYMYDTRNLPDPATKSGNNAFTGTNSFVGGKFSVNGFKVMGDSTYRIAQEYSDTTTWARGFEMFANNVRVGNTGFKGIGGNPEYYFIGVGNNIEWDTSQYMFYNNRIKVPDNFALTTNKGYGIVNFLRNEYTNDMLFGSSEWGVILRSNDTDINHLKKGTIYKIWDASNLPTPASTSDIPDVSDMARRSEANTFTANNSFTAGQFSVGSFMVSSSGSFGWNGNASGEWARECYFYSGSSGDTSPVIAFGGYGDGSDNTVNYAYIRVGDAGYASASYKFWNNKLTVPKTWSLNDPDNNAVIWVQGSSNTHLGRGVGNTFIRSGNTIDLYHTKGTTNYKILDESNYSQYLPTTSKWTYGFVTINPRGNNVDFNTVLSGPDSPKILLNYDHELGNDTNAPTGMQYGAVLQIDGNYNSSYNNNALRPQLAFDVNHNAEASTRYMWFRTANNLGYGDSSNWKRVVTADENVAVYSLDSSNYATLKYIDGNILSWLRAPTLGIVPNTQVTLSSGGIGSVGTTNWAFKTIASNGFYGNNYFFGNTGMHLEGNADEIGLLNNGVAKKLKVGSLLVSANYANTTLVPNNGIFSSGRIQSNDSMLVGYTRNTTGGQLGYGLYYAGASNVGLGSEYSSGALILYKSVNPNIDSSGYNVPVAGTVTPTYLKITNGTVKLGVGTNKAYTAGEAVTMTEYTLASLDAVNTKLGSYLPLTGGTVGQLVVSKTGSTPLIVNNSDTGGTDVIQTFRVKGNNKFLLGWSESGGGAFIQRSDNNRCMVLMSDGLYTGSALGSTVRVATLTDLGSYATQSWVTSQGYLTSHQAIYALTFAAGAFAAKTFTPTSSAVTVNVPTKTSHLTNDSGFLTSVPSTYATQSWVTSQGYLTSITKSMVTTALGYTPPTTNTTYSQATSSTLGLVKIGASSLGTKEYAVALNSSGQMYVSVPWTDTNTTYSAATSSTYGLVKIGATGLASKNYAVQLNSSGQMYVAVPWTDTDTNTHYTTRLYAGASGTAANSATTSPYIKVTDDNTYRNQIRLLGGGATSVSSDASGNITITSTNTTYGLATASSNGLMSSSQYTKLSNCIETVSATNMVTSVQVVDTIPATSSQVTGRLYLKFA